MPKPSAEKQEYFQSFAQELREIVSSGIPGMIADSDPDVVPPPPPPKRSLQNVEVKPPPTPPPWVREATVLSTLPPPIVNAEKIDLRVDQAFSDWKTDFAAVSVFAPPTAEEEPPPPPPPPKYMPMLQNQMPRPPPRPISNRPSGSSGSRATPMGSKDEALRTLAKAPGMPAAATWTQVESSWSLTKYIQVGAGFLPMNVFEAVSMMPNDVSTRWNHFHNQLCYTHVETPKMKPVEPLFDISHATIRLLEATFLHLQYLQREGQRMLRILLTCLYLLHPSRQDLSNSSQNKGNGKGSVFLELMIIWIDLG